MQALHTAATGMAAQELNVQVISNNIANLRTTGYKKQTRGVPGPDLRARPPRRRAGLRPGHHPAGRRRHRRRRQDRRHAARMTPGHAVADRQRPRPRDPRRRLLQDPDARRHLPAYTRDGTFQMDNQGRVVTAQGNPVQPTITIPKNASGITVNAQGQVSVTLPGSTTPTVRRPDRPDPLHQQGRPAAGRQQPVHRDAVLRRAAGRHRQRRRLRQYHAGQPRAGQCRRRLGNVRPDRRAARLRDERQGHQRRRPDAAVHHGAVPLRR